MRPGPKPQTTATKRLRGFPGKRRVVLEPTRAPLPPAAAFDDVPSELEGQPAARDEWVRLVPLLRRAGQLADLDRGVVVAMCLEWGTYVRARDQIRARGLTVKTPNKYEVSNAFLPIANRALRNYMALWDALGLMPSSRRQARTDPAATDDDFAEFDDVPPKVQ